MGVDDPEAREEGLAMEGGRCSSNVMGNGITGVVSKGEWVLGIQTVGRVENADRGV